MRPVVRLLLPAALLALPAALPAQYFGQNKVQYSHFNFKVLQTEHFDLYYYPTERAAAFDVARMAERSYARLSLILDHQFRERKPIILYASESDFQQTNTTPDEVSEGTGGFTDFLKHRIVLPMTGSYADIEHVLQHEMTHQFQYDIWSGGRAGAGIQTLIAVNPPLWFVEGMAEYMSLGGVDPNTAMWLRDAAAEGKIPTIDQLENDPRIFPYRFGQALCAYIGHRWGDEVFGAILKGSRAGGLEASFRRNIGLDFKQLGDQWRDAVDKEYLPQLATADRANVISQLVLNKDRSDGTLHLAPALSPDGQQVAYFSEGNFYFVDLWLANVADGKPVRRLFKSTWSSNYETFRFINSSASWSPDGKYLAFAGQRGSRDDIIILDVARNKEVGAIKLHAERGDHAGVESRRQAPGVHRLRRRHVGPVPRRPRRLAPDAAHQRSLCRSQSVVVARWPHHRVHHRPRPRNRLHAAAHRQLPHRAVPSGQQPDRGPPRHGRGEERRSAVVAGRQRARVRVGPHRCQQHLSLRPRRPAIVPDHQLLHRRPGHHAAVAGAVVGARQRQAGVRLLRRRGLRCLRDGPTRRVRKHGPWNAATALAAATPAQPGTPPPADTGRSTASQGGTTLYRSAAGLRRADSLGPVPDTIRLAEMTMAHLLDSSRIGLPDTNTFAVHPYKTVYTPDYVARPSIGYARSNFGQGVYGGTAIELSDMLGDHEMLFSGYVNGRIDEAQVLAAYVNLTRRINWATGISQDPYFYYQGDAIVQGQPSSAEDTYIQRVESIVLRSAFLTAGYPVSRFQRFEGGLHVTNVEDAVLDYSEPFDPASGLLTGNPTTTKTVLAEPVFLQPSLAWVYDNSIDGYTGPFLGRRSRVEIAPAIGGWMYNQVTADYRRYDRIAGPVTLATRLLYFGRTGRDADRFSVYLGYPDFIRGYTSGSYLRNECANPVSAADSTSQTGCAALDQLVGTSLALGNVELRFPILEPGMKFLPSIFPPIEGALFYDAGVTWKSGSELRWSRPAGASPSLVRTPLTSVGVSLRINLLGYMVLRFDYAKPLQRPGIHPYWTISFGPAY